MEQESINSPPYTLFYSYSHKDEELRDLLDKQLIMLRRSGLIREWYDRKILPGDDWDKEISQHLDAAKIILLLISSDFLASEYCYDIEAKRALERYEKGEVCLIPVILRPVVWQLTPFSKIQALPKNALPVEQWGDLDLAFVNICEGILAVIMSLKSGNEIVPAADSFKPSAEPRPLVPQTYSRRRVLDAALPDRVAVGKAVTLVAMIRRQDSEGLRKILRVNEERYKVSEEDVYSSDSFPLEFPLDSEGEPQPLDLAIKIESPDFEPKTQTKGIRILPRGDTEPRIFLLAPQREGDLFVNVELYKDDRLVTGCLLDTKASQTESETRSVNLTSVALNSEDKTFLPSPPSPASPNSQNFNVPDGYPPIANYSDVTSQQNYENKMSQPPTSQPSYSPSPNIAAQNDNAPIVNRSSKKRSPLFAIAAALVVLIFPVMIGVMVLLRSGGEAVNANSSVFPANYGSNVFPVNYSSNVFRAGHNSNISRAEYDRDRAKFEAEKGNSTIGQGANDSWIWFKTKSALKTDSDLRGSTINVDVANDVITLRGTVATAAQKKAAEAAARRIEGQKGVKNELKVQAGNSASNQTVGGNGNTGKPNTNANIKRRVITNKNRPVN